MILSSANLCTHLIADFTETFHTIWSQRLRLLKRLTISDLIALP